jgi:hypothetical protein
MDKFQIFKNQLTAILTNARTNTLLSAMDPKHNIDFVRGSYTMIEEALSLIEVAESKTKKIINEEDED